MGSQHMGGTTAMAYSPSPLASHWWETVSAMTRPHLKAHGRRLDDVTNDLDTIKVRGIDAIEIFAPCAGGTCYNGLDTIDYYTVDPAIGTMDDFKRLLTEAHRRGIAVVIFINLGYSHEQFPAFLQACDDMHAGIDSLETRMFVWSDTGQDVMPKPLAPYFLQDAHGNWRWSERAGSYFWVKWEGERGGYHLPQFNFGDPGWQQECRRILQFWLDTGIDGVVIDAVNWYIDCDWPITRAAMTNVINAAPNQFSQPEGAGGFGDDPVPWIREGGFTCVMDYAVKLWWEGKDVIRDAIVSSDPRPIEATLRGYRDRVVEAGGVCYINAPHLPDTSIAAQLLGAATIATVGELFLDVDNVYSTWSDEYQHGIVPLLEARRRFPALCAVGTRLVLPTTDDSRYYAFLRVPPGGATRMLVVLNFQPETSDITVDLYGQNISTLRDIWSETVYQADRFEVRLPGHGFVICEVA